MVSAALSSRDDASSESGDPGSGDPDSVFPETARTDVAHRLEALPMGTGEASGQMHCQRRLPRTTGADQQQRIANVQRRVICKCHERGQPVFLASDEIGQDPRRPRGLPATYPSARPFQGKGRDAAEEWVRRDGGHRSSRRAARARTVGSTTEIWRLACSPSPPATGERSGTGCNQDGNSRQLACKKRVTRSKLSTKTYRRKRL